MQIDLLAPIRELLSDPKRWCKNSYARDENGRATGVHDADAASWCIAGAAKKTIDGMLARFAIYDEFSRRAAARSPHCDYAGFNDHPSRTHAEIMEMLGEPFYAESRED